MTQAGAFGRAFDEARDVGEHEARFAGARHAERRIERGERIVGDLGRALDTARMKLDLPAFGKPSRPTSASTRSSSVRLRLSPGSPRVNWRGARLTLDLKCTLPSPPCAAAREQRTRAVLRQVGDQRAVVGVVDQVPTGTRSSRSRPARPSQSEPMPRTPFSARWMRAKR